MKVLLSIIIEVAFVSGLVPPARAHDSARAVRLSTSAPTEGALLRDVSPIDKPWDRHKLETQRLARIFSRETDDPWFHSQAARMEECAQSLTFGDCGGEYKLVRASFCRCRLCSNCQWRRSLFWRARFFQALPSIMAEYAGHVPLFLTLTVKNCPVEELGDTVTLIRDAWNRLKGRRFFKDSVAGWIRAVEVTRGKDGNAHPHCHIILLVHPYMMSGRGYVTQSQWAEHWRTALKADYTPIVDIRRISERATKKREHLGLLKLPAGVSAGLGRAVLEVAKYATKTGDMLGEHGSDHGWLFEYARQVDGRRFIGAGGCFKDVLKKGGDAEETEEDLLLQKEEKDESAAAYEFEHVFWWHGFQHHYFYFKTQPAEKRERKKKKRRVAATESNFAPPDDDGFPF